MAGTVDVVRWAEALECGTVEDLQSVLDRACARIDTAANEVMLVQSALTGLGSVDQDAEDLLLRLRALTEATWLALDLARRTAITAAASSASGTAAGAGGAW